MTTPIFNSTGTLLIVILGMLAFGLWFAKTKPGKNVGPALTVMLTGVLLYNVGVVPAYHDIYGSILTYCVPVSIAILLLRVDLSEMRKISRQPLMAMVSAVFSVSLAAFLFGLVFAGSIEEGWKVSGMFVGTYTGGSANLTAIAVGLGASSDTIAAANAADYVVMTPLLLLLFAAPNLLRKWKWFQRVWPYHFSKEELLDQNATEGSGDLLGAKTWSIFDITRLLALGFAINEAALALSILLFPESFASAGKMLLLTTFALTVGQIPAIKRIHGKIDIGMLLAMMFLAIIGFTIDLKSFLGSTFHITLFCLAVIVVCTAVHLLITRLLKIKYELVVLSITAAIADGPTAALVAAGGNWGSLVGIGLICGTLGAVLGNYCGIGVAYLVRGFVGG